MFPGLALQQGFHFGNGSEQPFDGFWSLARGWWRRFDGATAPMRAIVALLVTKQTLAGYSCQRKVLRLRMGQRAYMDVFSAVLFSCYGHGVDVWRHHLWLPHHGVNG